MENDQYRSDLLGNFADIHIGQFDGGRLYVRKILGDKDGGYSLEQATNAVNLMQRYILIANRINLPIAETYDHFIQESKKKPGRFVVNQTQQYLGRDVETIIKNDAQPIPAIRGYLDCLRIVAQNDFRISLDVHTANFCLDRSENVRYIDFMPPRQILNDGQKVAVFPEPTATLEPFFIDRIFTLEGQLPDVYSKILRALSYNKNFYSLSTPSLIRSLLTEFFDKNTVTNVIDESRAFKQKRIVDISDVNSIRILSTEKFFTGSFSTDKLEHIFSLTHFSPHGKQPTTDTLETAVRLLHS